MPAILLSDVHLTDSTGAKAQRMLRFFRETASQFEKIYILGDFFDVWPGTNSHLIEEFSPFLDLFRSLVRSGHQLTYVEGNHDFRLGTYFSNELGIRVVKNELVETWAGKRVYLVHGDLGNPAEKAYPMLRSFLRKDWLHWAIKPIPPQSLYSVASSVSRLSRTFQKSVPSDDEKVREIYRATAKELFALGNDVVIMGHTHVPDHFHCEVEGRACSYYNLGDWVRSFTYLEFDGAEFYTKKCLGAAPFGGP
jgi:UDP-2,3-diacylglucosamine hydrolase